MKKVCRARSVRNPLLMKEECEEEEKEEIIEEKEEEGELKKEEETVEEDGRLYAIRRSNPQRNELSRSSKPNSTARWSSVPTSERLRQDSVKELKKEEMTVEEDRRLLPTSEQPRRRGSVDDTKKNVILGETISKSCRARSVRNPLLMKEECEEEEKEEEEIIEEKEKEEELKKEEETVEEDGRLYAIRRSNPQWNELSRSSKPNSTPHWSSVPTSERLRQGSVKELKEETVEEDGRLNAIWRWNPRRNELSRSSKPKSTPRWMSFSTSERLRRRGSLNDTKKNLLHGETIPSSWLRSSFEESACGGLRLGRAGAALSCPRNEHTFDAADPSNLKVAHAISSILFWGILIPIGAFLGRHRRLLPGGSKWQPRWKYVHGICNFFALIGGFVDWWLTMGTLKLSTSHSILAAFVYGVAGFQFFLGLLGSWEEETLAKKAHRILGYIVLVAGICNCLEGVFLLGMDHALRTAFVGFILLFLLTSLILDGSLEVLKVLNDTRTVISSGLSRLRPMKPIDHAHAHAHATTGPTTPVPTSTRPGPTSTSPGPTSISTTHDPTTLSPTSISTTSGPTSISTTHDPTTPGPTSTTHPLAEEVS